MITIRRSLIIGPADSGKTYAGRLLTKHNTPYLVNGRKLLGCRPNDITQHIRNELKCINPDQQIIWVDDIQLRQLDTLLYFFCDEEYAIYPQAKNSFIYRPIEIVLSCTCELLDIAKHSQYLRHHYQVYSCGQANSAGVAMMVVNPEIFSPQTNLSL